MIGASPPRNIDRQVLGDAVQALGHLIAGPVDVDAVLKIDSDVREGIFGDGPQDLLVGDAEKFQLDGCGDTRLDFFGRHSRRLHDHLHLHRRDIGEGVDWQAVKCITACRDQGRSQHQDDQALAEGEFDKPAQHFTSPPRPAPAKPP